MQTVGKATTRVLHGLGVRASSAEAGAGEDLDLGSFDVAIAVEEVEEEPRGVRRAATDGAVRVVSTAATPDRASETWNVFDVSTGEWVDAPGKSMALRRALSAVVSGMIGESTALRRALSAVVSGMIGETTVPSAVTVLMQSLTCVLSLPTMYPLDAVFI
jgi:hypothetical protein